MSSNAKAYALGKPVVRIKIYERLLKSQNYTNKKNKKKKKPTPNCLLTNRRKKKKNREREKTEQKIIPNCNLSVDQRRVSVAEGGSKRCARSAML